MELRVKQINTLQTKDSGGRLSDCAELLLNRHQRHSINTVVNNDREKILCIKTHPKPLNP